MRSSLTLHRVCILRQSPSLEPRAHDSPRLDHQLAVGSLVSTSRGQDYRQATAPPDTSLGAETPVLTLAWPVLCHPSRPSFSSCFLSFSSCSLRSRQSVCKWYYFFRLLHIPLFLLCETPFLSKFYSTPLSVRHLERFQPLPALLASTPTFLCTAQRKSSFLHKSITGP